MRPDMLAYRHELQGELPLTDSDDTRRFHRTIGVAYSGAETAESSLKGLRVYRTVGG